MNAYGTYIYIFSIEVFYLKNALPFNKNYNSALYGLSCMCKFIM